MICDATEERIGLCFLGIEIIRHGKHCNHTRLGSVVDNVLGTRILMEIGLKGCKEEREKGILEQRVD